ncbi:MAG: DUF5522 domain-containing protein [Acidimicrobiia bacterium]
MSSQMDDLPAAVIAAHERAVAAGEPGYLDPHTGLFVFTAAYHLERGSCCASGCRHCPYDERTE